MRIELYGMLAEAAGHPSLEIPAPAEGTVAGALEAAAHACPALRPHLSQVAVAVGDHLVPPEAAVDEDSELALLPPVSGG
ncbi:MAG: MoaD/ThiS family protein [Halorhodospira sp.]